MKKVVALALFCIIPLHLEGMEAQRALYRLNTVGKGEVLVSKELIDAIPWLRERAQENQRTSFKVDLTDESCASIALIDKLIILTDDKRAEEINKLDNASFAQLIRVLYEFNLFGLLDTSLKVYAEKFMPVQNRVKRQTSVKTLTELASSYIADHYDEFDFDALPLLLQYGVLRKIPLTTKNYRFLYTWIEKLNAQHQEQAEREALFKNRRLPSPLILSGHQYASLDAVADWMQEVHRRPKKILAGINSLSGPVTGQAARMRLELIRRILRAEDSPLSKAQRFKIAWRSAVHEASIHSDLFDELAYFLLNNPFCDAKDAPCFFLRLPTNADFFWIKLLVSHLHGVVKSLKRGEVPGHPSSLLCGDPPVLESFLLSCIDDIHQELQQIPLHLSHRLKGKINPAALKKKIDFLTSIMSAKKSFDALVWHSYKKSLQAHLEQSVRGIEVTSEVFFAGPNLPYRVACIGLAQFSQVPLCLKIEEPKKQELNQKFQNAIKQVIADLADAGFELDSCTGGLAYLLRCRLISLLTEGAELMSGDEKGDTVAHKAFASNNRLLISFLAFVAEYGLGKIDMHRKNNEGLTPLMIMHTLDPQSSYELRELALIAKASKEPPQFSDGERGRLDALTASFADNLTIEEIVRDKIMGYDIAFWHIFSPYRGATYKVRLAWLLALKETNELHVRKLLGALSISLDTRKNNPEIPVLFYITENLVDLCTTVKQLQNGSLSLRKAADRIPALHLLRLLKFSGCLWQCLYSQEPDETYVHKLVTISRLHEVCDCIARGADVNYQDKSGNSLMHYAVANGNEELITLLLDLFGEKIKMDVKNAQGNTPLLLAAQHPEKALSLAKLLLSKKSIRNLSIFAANASGCNALDYLKALGVESVEESQDTLSETSRSDEEADLSDSSSE